MRVTGQGRSSLMVVVAAALATATLAPPAFAATTHVTAVAAPSVAYIGSTVQVTGSVSKPGGTLELQRYSRLHWSNVSHGTTNAAGHFTLTMKAPHHGTTLILRVTEASAPARSKTMHVRVVNKIFTVRATTPGSVSGGSAVLVTGSVSPKTTAAVWLQARTGTAWHNVVSAKPGSTARFSLSTVLPTGTYSLRVAKAANLTVAAGVSKTMTVTVAPVAPAPAPGPGQPPAVTTTALPSGTVGFAYAANLTASGGTAPYTWTSASLPAGLTLSAAGLITGKPTTAATSTVAVTVTDAAGGHSSATFSVVVAGTTAIAWGSNASGQLGDGTMADSASTGVGGLTDVISMAGGSVNGYAALANGTVWAWGANDQGQLGDGSTDTTDIVASPVQVSGLTGVTSVVSANESVYALRSDGTVWAWGFNGYGDLGNGTADNANVPVEVSNLTGVMAIAAAGDDGYALKSDGTVWAWGINTIGELGDTLVPDSHVPVQVYQLTGVTAIGAGARTGYAVRGDGTVWGWGWNGDGELGTATNVTWLDVPIQIPGLSGATMVTGGSVSGYAVEAGRVWAWGGNTDGQLGQKTKAASTTPVEMPNLSGVTAITAGVGDVYALVADGSVWATGYDANYQLGPVPHASSPLDYYPGPIPGIASLVAIGSGSSSESAYASVRGLSSEATTSRTSAAVKVMVASPTESSKP